MGQQVCRTTKTAKAKNSKVINIDFLLKGGAVLFHISHVKTFRTQLAIFRLLNRKIPETTISANDCSSEGDAEKKIRHPRFTAKEEEESSSSDAEDSEDDTAEPLLKKGQTIISTTALSGGDCLNIGGNVKNFVLKETWARKERKKNIKFIPLPPALKHKDKYPKAETILKNKKSVMETLAMLFSSSLTAKTERKASSKSTDDDKYFCYHRSSEYSIDHKGGLNQTEDLKRYYKQQKQKTEKSLIL
jgi:hypothetical protein